MSMSLRSLLAASLALSLTLGSAGAFAQEAVGVEARQQDVELWKNFGHFTLVAQPEAAVRFGQQLLQLENQPYLAAIEAAPEQYDPMNIAKWTGNDVLRGLWNQLFDKYQAALTERSRSEAQIRADIETLDDGTRARWNAIKRLKETGQFAAPYFVEYLEDDSKRALHPFIIPAMKEIGISLVYPVALALPHVKPATQQKLADVLATVGHPEAMPYLKMVAESDKSDANIKDVARSAMERVASNVNQPTDASAADMFVALGEKHYRFGTLGQDIEGLDFYNEVGIVWTYSTETNLLIPTDVPRQVYADVRAMQSARTALELDANKTDALTLHLASNLRRENNLDGQQDKSYTLPNPPAFYLLLAGADQQKSVLARALSDMDADLALDGIEAMAKTSGDAVLLGSDNTRKPVLDALYYSDRRVRFTAALTLAQAKPGAEYPGSFSVVPVLGQAVRQSEKRNALVVAGEPDLYNAAMEGIDFGSVAADSLDVAGTKAAAAFPGVDLIVYTGDLLKFRDFMAQIKADGELSVVPVLALVDPNAAVAIGLEYPNVVTADPLAFDSDAELPDAELDRLERLSSQAIDTYGGEPISADEALVYAEGALALLEEIAGNQSIYEARDVMSILIEALDDDRPTVATGAGRVLALIDEQVAQEALTEAALTRPGSVQIALLGSLAESAKNFGNQLDAGMVDRLAQLVTSSSGDTALAAARAHGALTELSTERATGILFSK